MSELRFHHPCSATRIRRKEIKWEKIKTDKMIRKKTEFIQQRNFVHNLINTINSKLPDTRAKKQYYVPRAEVYDAYIPSDVSIKIMKPARTVHQ
jgi:hypothetical protein